MVSSENHRCRFTQDIVFIWISNMCKCVTLCACVKDHLCRPASLASHRAICLTSTAVAFICYWYYTIFYSLCITRNITYLILKNCKLCCKTLVAWAELSLASASFVFISCICCVVRVPLFQRHVVCNMWKMTKQTHMVFLLLLSWVCIIGAHQVLYFHKTHRTTCLILHHSSTDLIDLFSVYLITATLLSKLHKRGQFSHSTVYTLVIHYWQ